MPPKSVKVAKGNSLSLPSPHLALSILAPDESDAKGSGTDKLQVRIEPIVASPSMVSAARGVLQPGKVYDFRVTRIATLTASGGGTMALSTAMYPSSFSQYSGLSLLFDEARLRSTRIKYVFLTPLGGPNSFVSSFNPTYNIAPSSATLAFRFPGARVFNTWNTVGTNTTNKYVAGDRPWSSITATGSTADPSGGVCGSWNHNLALGVTGAVIVADYYIEADYQFRNPL